MKQIRRDFAEGSEDIAVGWMGKARSEIFETITNLIERNTSCRTDHTFLFRRFKLF